MKRPLFLGVLCSILLSQNAISADYNFNKATDFQNFDFDDIATYDEIELKTNQNITSIKCLTGSNHTFSINGGKKSMIGVGAVGSTFDLACVNFSDKTQSVAMHNMTLTHAKNVLGRAIEIDSGTLQGTSLIIKDNSRVGDSITPDILGGGIYGGLNGSMVLQNSSFTGNKVTGYSAIASDGSAAAIVGGSVGGSGFYFLLSDSSTLTLKGKTIFSGNIATGGAGQNIVDTALSTVRTAGNGGDVNGGVINIDSSNLTTSKTANLGDLDLISNNVQGGKGGNSNVSTVGKTATGGKGGDVNGGIIKLDGLELSVNINNLNINKNIIKGGKGGDTFNDSELTTTGNGGNISGGLIHSESELNVLGKTTLDGNTISSGETGTANLYNPSNINSIIAASSTGNITGGLFNFQQNTDKIFDSDVLVKNNKITTSNGIAIDKKLKSSASGTAGSSGSILGSMFYLDSSPLELLGNNTITGNTISTGNGGTASAGLNNSMIGGDSGYIYGGIFYIKNSSDVSIGMPLYNGILNITGNKFITGNGGDTFATGTGIANGGNVSNVSGAFIYSLQSDLESFQKTNFTGNTITLGKAGNATAITGNATGGKVASLVGGIISANENSRIKFYDNVAIDKNIINIGGTGNATSTSGDAVVSKSAGIGSYDSINDIVYGGGFIDVVNSSMTFAKNSSFNNNKITIANSGNATSTSGNASIFNSDSSTLTVDAWTIYGGIFHSGVTLGTTGSTQSFNRSAAFNGNTISIGKGGNATTKTGSGVAKAGSSAIIQGGLISGINNNMFQTNSFKFSDVFNMNNNTINVGVAGDAKSVDGDAFGGNAYAGSLGDQVNGGLVFGATTNFTFGGTTMFSNNKLTLGKAGNATSVSGDASGGNSGITKGGVLFSTTSNNTSSNFKGATTFSNNIITAGAGGNATTTKGTNAKAGNGGSISGGGLYFEKGQLNFNITDKQDSATSTTIKDLVMFSGNQIKSGNGGNASADKISGTAIAGNGGNAFGGGMYLNNTTATFNDSVYFTGNNAIAGNGGNATSGTTKTAGNGGNASGGAMYINGSNVSFTGSHIVFSGNNAIAGKGGNGTIKGADGNAFGGAIYLNGTTGTSNLTFSSTNQQYILFENNKAGTTSESIYIGSNSNLKFDLKNSGSLAIIKDGIASDTTSTASLTKSGAGSMFVSGNSTNFRGKLDITGGLFAVVKGNTSMTTFGGLTSSTAPTINVANGAYLGIQLGNARVAFGNSSNLAAGARILPIGISAQSGSYMYYAPMLMRSYNSGTINSLFNYIDTNNVLITNSIGNTIYTGFVSINLTAYKRKEFSNGVSGLDFSVKSWVDSYIKTLDPYTMAMFDKAFVLGSNMNTTDSSHVNYVNMDYINKALAEVKRNPKRKLLNQVTISKTGINQMLGLLEVYGVGSGSINKPTWIPLAASDSHDFGKGKVWLVTGYNDKVSKTESDQDNLMNRPFMAFGTDYKISSNFTLGIASQIYDRDERGLISNGIETNVKGASLALYGKATDSDNKYYLSFGTIFDNNINSQNTKEALAGTSTGNYDSNNYSIVAELGRNFAFGKESKVVLTPHFGMQFDSYTRGAYSETSSNGLTRNYSEMNWNSINTPIGLRIASNEFKLIKNIKTSLYSDISYSYDFGDTSTEGTANIKGNGHTFSWNVETEKVGRHTAKAELGINTAFTENSSLSVKYQGEHRNNQEDQNFKFDYKYKF